MGIPQFSQRPGTSTSGKRTPLGFRIPQDARLGKACRQETGVALLAPVNAPLGTTPTPTRQLSASAVSGLRRELERELDETHTLEARLRDDIATSFESRRSTTSDETDDPEGANIAFEGAQAASMLQQTSLHAAEIAAALERMDAGTYGACANCGNQIAQGRLEARPASALCIGCAS